MLNMIVHGMTHRLIFLVICAPCLVKAYCNYKYRSKYGDYDCAGKDDGTKCCYKDSQGYCSTTTSGNKICINGATGTCMFHKCEKYTGGGCTTVAKTGKTGCLDRTNIACIGKDLNEKCSYTGGSGKWEGLCGTVSLTVGESEVLGCGTNTSCYACIQDVYGACLDKLEGDACRTYREYTSASDFCGRGTCTPGWTTYTGGTCVNGTFRRMCMGATGTFTPDNPVPKGIDGDVIFYLVLIALTLMASATSVCGIRTLVEVRGFAKRVKELLESDTDKGVVEGKILGKKSSVHQDRYNNDNSQTNSVTYDVTYEFRFTSDEGETKKVTNTKCVLKQSYDKLPEANSPVKVIYSKSDVNFNFTEIDAEVEINSNGRLLFGYIFILMGLGTLFTIIMMLTFVGPMLIEAPPTGGIITSIMVYMVVTGAVGIAVWKGKISAGRTLTYYAAGKSKIKPASTRSGDGGNVEASI